LEELSDSPRLELEKAIDAMQERLEPLTQFILPGGHESAGLAHVARTVCRRAERHTVAAYCAMNGENGLSQIDQLLVYLNRLSDYLFVLARCCNVTHGLRDTVWNPS
jgi:cob(I)alamin adenosyltransferase